MSAVREIVPAWLSDAAELLAFAAQYEGQDEDGARAAEFEWRYEPEFDLGLLGGTPGEWAEWLDGEERMLDDEGIAPGRYRGVAAWWLTEPEREPLVVVEAAEGFRLWDGAHRAGISFRAGRTRGPAVVGRGRR